MRQIVMGIAAGLSGLTLGVHLFAGGPEYHATMRAALQQPVFQSMLSVLWHAVSVFLAVLTLAMLWLWRAPNRALALTLSAVMLGWAALFLYFGLQDLGTVWRMPQWVIFVALPGALIWAHKAV